MKYSSIAIIVALLVVAAPPVHAARPTLRTLRDNAPNGPVFGEFGMRWLNPWQWKNGFNYTEQHPEQ